MIASPEHSMTVSIMITTRNRAEDLDRTLMKLDSLEPPPLEILVTADGCSDGTIAMVQERYPDVHLLVNQINLGSIASRDRMLRLARGDLVLSLDDDSYPLESDCCDRLRELFAKHSAAGLIHFPQKTDEFPESLVAIGPKQACLTATYSNAGACYRRDVYNKASGFIDDFFHAYEEPDFGLQLLAAGYSVVLEPGLTIRHHYTSVERSEMRTHQRHARNELLSVLVRSPLLLIPFLLPYRVLSQAVYAASRGVTWLIREPLWWWSALRLAPRLISLRQPVELKVYLRWMELSRNPEVIHDESGGTAA